MPRIRLRPSNLDAPVISSHIKLLQAFHTQPYPFPTLIPLPTQTRTIMADALKSAKIAFLGGGNMAAAIIGGLAVDRSNITVSEPWDVNREKMAALGVRTTISNVEAGVGADVLIVSVKPQVARTVCEELAAAWKDNDGAGSRPVVVSIAAGINMESLQRWLSTEGVSPPHIVRVMPNTPALVGEGASGLVASADVTPAEKDLVDTLFKSVSRVTEWVDREELLDVVTGLSGMYNHCVCILIEMCC